MLQRLVAPLSAATLFLGAVTPAHAATTAPDASVADIASKLIPSVVSLAIWANVPGKDGDAGKRLVLKAGSGFVIGTAGGAITNRHLVENSFRIQASFQDGTACPARLVGTPTNGDVALLQLECGRDLPALEFGDSGELRVGEPVLALGNPEGLGISASTGVVSALNRIIEGSAYLDYLQTDASINPGNSGGPLFNLRGQVIGMDTAFYAEGGKGGSQGLGFALPSEELQVVIRRLKADGSFTLGRAGLRAQTIDAKLAAALGLPSAGGAIIDGVDPDSTAEKAGLTTGDAIRTANGAPLRDAVALNRLVGDRPGGSLQLGIVRDGAHRELTLTIAADALRPVDAIAGRMPALKNPSDYGLALAALPGASAEPAASVSGLFVQDVAEKSAAAAVLLQTGDVLLKLGRRELRTADDFTHAIVDASAARQTHILVQVLSKDVGVHFNSLPVFSGDGDGDRTR